MIKILLIKDDIIGWVNPAVIKNVILLTKQNKMEVYTKLQPGLIQWWVRHQDIRTKTMAWSLYTDIDTFQIS